MKKNVLLGLALIIFNFNALEGQTFYPDGETFFSDEVVSFDWYLDGGPNQVGNSLYVENAAGETVLAVYGNPSGQNYNDGSIFAPGDYKWYAKAYDAATGTVYKLDYRFFSVIEGFTPVFSPDGATFHPNQVVSFNWYVPDTVTANALFVYNSADAVVYQSVDFPGGQQHDAGQKFENGTYRWRAIYTEKGVEKETDLYAFTVEGDANVTVLEQYGIEWYIQGIPEYGQYANGEYWVVGPVTLVKITPQSIKYNMQTLPDGSPLPEGVESHDIDRIINGSMVNPEIGYDHGYDDEMTIWKPITNSYPERVENYAGNKSYYKEELNIARIDTGGGNFAPISVQHPRIVQPNSSVVSTISTDIPDRPNMEATAILTVVDGAHKPVEGDLRPPYCGNDKRSYYNISGLDYSSLKALERAENFLSLEEAESFFERNWIDYIPEWMGEFTHAKQNMRRSYGADVAGMISLGALALNTEYGNGTADKEMLLKRMVQLGLDLYGAVTQPGGENIFRNNGGLLVGRKFPVLLAGKALGNDDILNIGSLRPDIHFHEDDQSFYVAQSDIDLTNGPTWNPDSRDAVTRAYQTEDIGLPEWGIVHATQPERSNKFWETAYRRCCNVSSVQGSVLAAHAMGIKENWAHNELFDYLDRYLSIEKQIYYGMIEDPDIPVSKSALFGRNPVIAFENVYGMFNMWELHRKSFGDVWTRCDTTDIYSNKCSTEVPGPEWSEDFPDSISITANSTGAIKMSDYVSDAETAFDDLVFTISTIDSLDVEWLDDTLVFSTVSTGFNYAGMVYIEVGNQNSGVSVDSVWVTIGSIVGVEDRMGSMDGYQLEQNFPNPFSQTTMITYRLEEPAEIELAVYNLLGQKVATLTDAPGMAGRHTVEFDASALAPGVYFYRLKAGDLMMIKKMLVGKSGINY
ncbi:MAG: T9SS type A sorting domain-containing protein [Bacteroidota bacterium]